MPLLVGLLALSLLAALGWFAWSRLHRTPAGGATADGATAASAPAPRVPGGRRFGGVNRVQPVSVVAVRRMDIRVTAQAIGNIAAANTAVVRSRVDAELQALHFKEGQPVRAGQLLAELDARPFRIALEQAQGQLARDQAQLANARVDLQRFQELLAKDAIAGQQVDTQSAQVRQLEGTVQSDRAAVDNAKLQLSYTRVTAPISGVASLKQADLGNIVHASDANGLLSIAQMQPVAVVFAVPEAQLPTIARRMKSGDALPVEAWDRDEKSRLAEGRVASVDNAIDPATGTIKLKALFANEDSRLFPNQFVNVRLQLDTIAHTLAVPGAAVQRGSAGAFVYAVNDDRSVTVRRVQPGAEDGGWVAVQGELREGENVVTDGADRLRDGAMVEVIQSPASTASDVVASAPAASRARRSSALAASVAAAGASSAERPAWFDRLPPEVQRQMAQMSPDERRAWMRQRQHERAARSREGTNAN